MATTFLVLGLPLSASAAACSVTDIASGSCSVAGRNNGESIDVWGSWSTPGSPDGGTNGSGGSGGTYTPLTQCPVVVAGMCEGYSPPKDAPPSEPTAPDSASDLASFRPRPPTQFGEPAGWSIVSLPRNGWMSAVRHTVSGTLFGLDADVRFTPVRYRWTYGDSASLTTTHPGSSWESLGQEPWSFTPTTHVYTTTGTFIVTAQVDYSAEYRFDHQGWVSVPGFVAARAAPLAVTVVAADTVLVLRDCASHDFGCVR